MARSFSDHRGTPIPYEDALPITWRISIYVVVVRDEKLLLMRAAYSEHHDLPGGMVEPEESLLAAASRECWEETGYRFDSGEHLPIFTGEQWYFEDDDDTYHHSLFFAVQGDVESEPDSAWRPIAGETERVVWLPLSEMASASIHPNHRRVLAVLLELDRTPSQG